MFSCGGFKKKTSVYHEKSSSYLENLQAKLIDTLAGTLFKKILT